MLLASFATETAREEPAPSRREGNQMGTATALLAASSGLDTVLWIIAAVLVIAGIFAIIRGAILWGIVLIIVGLLVGPGGVSIFT
jgi:hypothetical protein